MKIIKNILIDIVITIWFIVALFATVCLLSQNSFGTTVFGKNTLLIIDSDELEPEFVEGDLLVVKRNSDNKIDIGDRVFYYNSAMNTTVLVYNGVVESKEEITRTETTYKINGETVSGEYIIGALKTTKAYHNFGTILGVITSQWGFLFFILFPMLFAIIYEVMMIIDTNKDIKDKQKIEE